MTIESLQDYMELQRSTAECDEGPEISMRPGSLTIRYDSESGASREWTTLRFPGAVALRVTPEHAASPMAIRAYNSVGLVENSNWIASLVGGAGDGRLRSDLKHFVVFFDHYGSIEAIAGSCVVEG